MKVKSKATKKHQQKTKWDALSKQERERLTEEYIYRVLSDKPTKRIAGKIAKLKGIRIS